MIHNSFFSCINRRIPWHWQYLILFFFSIFTVSSYAQTVDEPKRLVITVAVGINNDKIERMFSEPFILERLTFDSDVHLEKEEFLYLADLSEGAQVSAFEIKKALSCLIKKNIFREIGIRMSQGVNGK